MRDQQKPDIEGLTILLALPEGLRVTCEVTYGYWPGTTSYLHVTRRLSSRGRLTHKAFGALYSPTVANLIYTNYLG